MSNLLASHNIRSSFGYVSEILRCDNYASLIFGNDPQHDIADGFGRVVVTV